MKEVLGYSILLAAVAPHMSPKTIQHYVLKCLNTEEVKACTKVLKTKNSSLCIHTWNLLSWNSTFIKRILIMSQTTFRDCRVHFCAFSDNLSRNSCILKIKSSRISCDLCKAL